MINLRRIRSLEGSVFWESVVFIFMNVLFRDLGRVILDDWVKKERVSVLL